MPAAAASVWIGLSLVWMIIELARGGVPWTPACLACLGALAAQFGAKKRPWEANPSAFLFFGCATLYLASFRWHGGDDLPTSLVPLAVLRDGTFLLDGWIDPFLTGKTNDFTLPAVGGHYISIYPVAAALLALPVYVVPGLAGVVPTDQFLHNLSKISAALITAGAVVALHKALVERASHSWALYVSILFGLGSWAFSLSSQALWQHGPASLGLALGLWGLSREGRRWDLLAGFGFALAVTCRPDSVIYAAAAGFYVLLHRTGRVPGFSAGAAGPAVLLIAYWLYYTGRLAPPESGFQGNFMIGFQPEAFIALGVSPTRGWLFFTPWMLFAFLAPLRRGADAESRWFAAAALASWAFFSCYGPWVGGTTFGTRYFAATAVVTAFICGRSESWLRASRLRMAAFAAAGAAGVLVHALGAYLTWPGSAWVGTAKMQAWWWSLHPWLFLMMPEGGLSALPFVLRALVAAALAALAVWGARNVFEAFGHPVTVRKPARKLQVPA